MNRKEYTSGPCPNSDTVVSYLYDELTIDAKLKFEDHLADCSYCIDEFAAVSMSRFEVFDWQLVEFADMPTPAFYIPHETDRLADLWNSVVNWISMTKGPVAAFASVVLILLTGSTIYIMRNDGQSTASIVTGQARLSDDAIPTNHSSAEPVAIASAVSLKPSSTGIKPSAHHEPSTSTLSGESASLKRKDQIYRRRTNTPNVPDPDSVAVQNSKARSLRLIEENEESDESLRISDLLVEADPNN